MKTLITSIFLSLLIFSSALAQDQIQMALTFYNNGQYKKAATLFKRIAKHQHSDVFFSYYIKSLVKSGETKKALRILHKQINHNPRKLNLKIHLAYVYKTMGKFDLEKQTLKDVIRKLPPNDAVIRQLANLLMDYRMYTWAAKIYEKGQQLTGKKYYNELYIAYSLAGDYSNMIRILLLWLKSNPAQYSNIIRIFQSYLTHDVNHSFQNQLFRQTLRFSQKYKNPIFNRVLIWYFVENKKFDLALTQAIAYNNKTHAGFAQIYKVGRLALENDSLNAAKKAFSIIINKGKNTPFYFNAKFDLLSTMYKQIISHQISDTNQIKFLEQQYIALIKQLGLNDQTFPSLLQLVHLQAFYLNNPQKAISYINSALKQPWLTTTQKGKLQIEKANILLRIHKPWQALLLLLRAQNQNISSSIGDQAKLLSAKIYFFLGDFTWAKKQFIILAGNTEKFTSNDAIKYLELIQSAQNDSSNLKILKLYAKAQFYQFLNFPDSALIMLDSVISYSSYLADRALIDKYKILIDKKQYSEAAQTLQFLINNFTQSVFIDKATYFLALLYQKYLNKPEQAKKLFAKILFDYKDSIFRELARRQYLLLLNNQSS